MVRAWTCAVLATAMLCGVVVGAEPLPVAVADLPVVKGMPDPLVMKDGTAVKTPEQWRVRREEMKKILEDYEYGHMPPAPGKVTGKVMDEKDLAATGVHYRLVHVTFMGGEKGDTELGFDVAMFSPLSGKGPWPTILSLSFGANERAAGQYKAAFERGYAVAVIGYQQLGADSKSYRSTAFFPAYPNYDWNDFSAWAWGISRAVDFLVTDPATDKDKLIATGTSRLGQAVLLAGAFDERISLVAPVAGGMAMRFSGKDRGGGQGIDEVVDQNTYWFGPHLVEFRGQTDKLPCDQHWLLALAAPRPFIMLNSLKDQYGNPYAAGQSYVAAKPVYAFLGAADNLGLNFREGTHGMTGEDWGALLDFADEKLRGKKSGRTFDHLPPAPETTGK